MKLRIFLFLLSLSLFTLFLVLSYLVAKEYFVKIDFDTTVKFQDKISRKLDMPFSLLSVLGSAEITGAFWLLLVLIFLIKRYFLTVLSLFLFPLALILEVLGKIFIHHPAPPFMFYRGIFEYTFPSSFVHIDYAYPSGHVMRTSFLVFFLSTYIYFKFAKYISFFTISILGLFLAVMLVSRIYLGEHWFSDVLGGFLLGSSFGILAGIASSKLKKYANQPTQQSA